MITHYDQLPKSADEIKIANVIKSVLIEFAKILSIRLIVDNVNRMNSALQVNENDLKMFMRRKDDARVNATNKTIRALFTYIKIHMMEKDGLPESARDIAWENVKILEPGYGDDKVSLFKDIFRDKFGRSLRDWVGSDVKQIRELSKHLPGKYVLLRKSSEVANIVLKSEIEISFDAISDILNIDHIFIDRDGRKRVSHGVINVVVDNLYSMCAVELNQAMEIFAFYLPLQRNARIELLSGFTLTVDLHRVLVSARVAIDRDRELWTKYGNRIEVDKLKKERNNIDRLRKIHLLDSGTSATVQR